MTGNKPAIGRLLEAAGFTPTGLPGAADFLGIKSVPREENAYSAAYYMADQLNIDFDTGTGYPVLNFSTIQVGKAMEIFQMLQRRALQGEDAEPMVTIHANGLVTVSIGPVTAICTQGFWDRVQQEAFKVDWNAEREVIGSQKPHDYLQHDPTKRHSRKRKGRR